MRQVQKPIKCLPVWYLQEMGESVTSWPIKLLEGFPLANDKVEHGSRLLSWSSKTQQSQVIDLISFPGADICSMLLGSQNFSMNFKHPVNNMLLSWPGTVSLLPAATPGCFQMSHQMRNTTHWTNIPDSLIMTRWKPGDKLGHYLESWG